MWCAFRFMIKNSFFPPSHLLTNSGITSCLPCEFTCSASSAFPIQFITPLKCFGWRRRERSTQSWGQQHVCVSWPALFSLSDPLTAAGSAGELVVVVVQQQGHVKTPETAAAPTAAAPPLSVCLCMSACGCAETVSCESICLQGPALDNQPEPCQNII